VTAPERTVVDLLTGTWRAQALHAAAELGLADGVADGHRTLADLARWADAEPAALRRLMRVLVELGVFEGDARAGYRPTPVSELLRSDAPGSMRALCSLYGNEFHRAWSKVATSVRTGGSGFEAEFGHSLHRHLATEPGAGPRFLAAMAAGSTFFRGVPDAHDFGGASTVVDVAGGDGSLLAAVLARHPHLHGVLLEQAHMAPIAERVLGEHVPADRYRVEVGDAFHQVPADADVYLLSRVLQDWDDERCVRLLTTCREAMKGPDSRLLVVERVVAESGGAPLSLLWDLHLLVVAGGGERTAEEYDALFAAAGLTVARVVDLALEAVLMVVAPV
jgi:hypothetical protein